MYQALSTGELGLGNDFRFVGVLVAFGRTGGEGDSGIASEHSSDDLDMPNLELEESKYAKIRYLDSRGLYEDIPIIGLHESAYSPPGEMFGLGIVIHL